MLPYRVATRVLLATLAIGGADFASFAAAGAKNTGVVVLMRATVTAGSEAQVPLEQWERSVRTWADAAQYANAQGPITLDACRAAGATYAVDATFALEVDLERAKRFPGRHFGLAHAEVLNCVTGTRNPSTNVHVMSDPPTAASEGDNESSSELT